MLSDTDSSDSDSGVRFKTASTRSKFDTSRPRPSEPTSGSSGRHGASRLDDDRDRRHRYERRSPVQDRKRRSPSRDRGTRHYVSGASNDRRRSKSRDRSNRSYRDQESHRDNPRGDDTKISKDRDRYQVKSRTSREDYEDKKRPSPEKTTSKSPKERSIQPKHEKSSDSSNADSNPPKDDRSSDEQSKKSKKTKRNKSKERESKHSTDSEHRSSSSRETKSNSLPRELENVDSKDSRDLSPQNDEDLMCGPKLPPHLSQPSTSADRSPPKNPSDVVLGPSLPPALLQPRPEPDEHSTPVSSDNGHRPVQGPSVPPPHVLLQHQHTDAMSDISDEDDDCPFGPVPDGMNSKSEAHLELEKRALELKLAKFGDTVNMDDLVVRDEWMLELPEVKGITDMGLTARQFRTKERPEMGDRSGWTETPNDRKSKRPKAPTEEQLCAEKQQEARAMFNENRDRVQEDEARKHKKKHKRDESLLDMHQKKLKQDKKKKKEDERVARRPFSREADLKVNRFDQAQKNAILKKAQLLDTRFGRGETKYL